MVDTGSESREKSIAPVLSIEDKFQSRKNRIDGRGREKLRKKKRLIVGDFTVA